MKKLSMKTILKTILFVAITFILCVCSMLASVYSGMVISSAAFSMFLTEDSLALAYVCMVSAASGSAIVVFYIGKLTMTIIRKLKEVIFNRKKD